MAYFSIRRGIHNFVLHFQSIVTALTNADSVLLILMYFFLKGNALYHAVVNRMLFLPSISTLSINTPTLQIDIQNIFSVLLKSRQKKHY